MNVRDTTDEELRARIWADFFGFGPWCGITREIHGITDWILDELVLARMNLPFGDAVGGPCPECPNFSEGCSRVGSCALGYTRQVQS